MSIPVDVVHTAHLPTPPPDISTSSNTQLIAELRSRNIHGAQYKILKPCGKGKFSIVYKCISELNNTIYALKKIDLFSPQFTDTSRNKCIYEIQLLQNLYHCSNIIQYIDSYIDEQNQLNIILQWADSGDLKQLIRNTRHLHSNRPSYVHEQQIWCYMYEISCALYYMHSNSIIHRDLKPANIMLDSSNHILLCDLGLSRYMSDSTIEAFSKVGTPLYIAPEVLTGNGYTYTADIWSLGCILYELCTLYSPFKPTTQQINLYALFSTIRDGKFIPVQQCAVHEYSNELYDVITLMLSMNVDQRPTLDSIMLYSASHCSDINQLKPVPYWDVQHITMDQVRSGQLILPTDGKGTQTNTHLYKRASSATTVKQRSVNTVHVNTITNDRPVIPYESKYRSIPKRNANIQHNVKLDEPGKITANLNLLQTMDTTGSDIGSNTTQSSLNVPRMVSPLSQSHTTPPYSNQLNLSRLPVGSPINKQQVIQSRQVDTAAIQIYDLCSTITIQLSLIQSICNSRNTAVQLPSITRHLFIQYNMNQQYQVCYRWCTWCIQQLVGTNNDINSMLHMIESNQSVHDTYVQLLKLCQNHTVPIDVVVVQTNEITLLHVMLLLHQLVQQCICRYHHQIQQIQYISDQVELVNDDIIDECIDSHQQINSAINHSPYDKVLSVVSVPELTAAIHHQLLHSVQSIPMTNPVLQQVHRLHYTLYSTLQQIDMDDILSLIHHTHLIQHHEHRYQTLLNTDTINEYITIDRQLTECRNEFNRLQLAAYDQSVRSQQLCAQIQWVKHQVAAQQIHHNDTRVLRSIQVSYNQLRHELSELNTQLLNKYHHTVVQNNHQLTIR